MDEKLSHIGIEMMMFGDYRVQVWDENLESLLGREYFCHGELSAILTAIGIQEDLFKNLPIFLRELDKLTKIYD